MRKSFYLSLLVFCTILSQGIAIISDKNIEKSTDFHNRKKRVIDHSSPGGVKPAHITMSRHLVQIQVHGEFECAGSILQADMILTIRNCLYESDDMYTVLSGSRIKNNGTSHRVLKSVKHEYSNLALLKIHPSINLNPHANINIKLFEGHLPPNTYGFFSSWGCTNISPEGRRTYPHMLMTTLLPIITLQECVRVIRATHGQLPHSSVLIICTLDPRRKKGACYGDEGGSLTYGGRLLGIYSHNGGVNLGVHPDIFMDLNDERIFRWINHFTREFRSIRPGRVGK